jgi:hypothetical protein
MSKSVEIEPASWTQVRDMGKDKVIIEEDLLDIVKQLKEISPTLFVRWSPGNGDPFYTLYSKEVVNGKETEYLVKTFKHLDQRIVDRVRYITSTDYNYVSEMDKLDDKQDSDHNYKMAELFGENAEKLAFALRKDLGLDKDRAFFSAN